MFCSRKFVLTMVALLLVTGGYIATWPVPLLAGSFPTFVGGVIG